MAGYCRRMLLRPGLSILRTVVGDNGDESRRPADHPCPSPAGRHQFLSRQQIYSLRPPLCRHRRCRPLIGPRVGGTVRLFAGFFVDCDRRRPGRGGAGLHHSGGLHAPERAVSSGNRTCRIGTDYGLGDGRRRSLHCRGGLGRFRPCRRQRLVRERVGDLYHCHDHPDRLRHGLVSATLPSGSRRRNDATGAAVAPYFNCVGTDGGPIGHRRVVHVGSHHAHLVSGALWLSGLGPAGLDLIGSAGLSLHLHETRRHRAAGYRCDYPGTDHGNAPHHRFYQRPWTHYSGPLVPVFIYHHRLRRHFGLSFIGLFGNHTQTDQSGITGYRGIRRHVVGKFRRGDRIDRRLPAHAGGLSGHQHPPLRDQP